MTRQEAIEILTGRYLIPVEDGANEHAERVNEAIDMAIEALKSERPKGEWVRATNPIGETIVVCSNCKKIRQQGYDDFCGACGADMRGDTE